MAVSVAAGGLGGGGGAPAADPSPRPPPLPPSQGPACTSLGLTLATGACADTRDTLVALEGEAATIPLLDCAARAARSPNPSAACCADLAAFAQHGCASEPATLAAAALAGLNEATICAGLALAAASCPAQHGVSIPGVGGAGEPCG